MGILFKAIFMSGAEYTLLSANDSSNILNSSNDWADKVIIVENSIKSTHVL